MDYFYTQTHTHLNKYTSQTQAILSHVEIGSGDITSPSPTDSSSHTNAHISETMSKGYSCNLNESSCYLGDHSRSLTLFITFLPDKSRVRACDTNFSIFAEGLPNELRP